ncbi:hypothetical protein J2Z40_002792 [Cytobacillus eiseniae]|uniref:DUF3993 domain-containing protein n=1 Tax=Cytobacillus eiseniae TaxID=762947 RepID=A0ABS4RIU8_9BACI|nr:hypothetical protein [Cytobacillus eiseniae]MBP2242219.1 hypothetical protein [Cytobacillus eiseniae]
MNQFLKISILSVLFLFISSIGTAFALEEKQSEVECERKKDFRNKEFNERIMNDIFTSFGHKYEEIIDQSMYINRIDLMKYTVLAANKDIHLESLKDHLSGESTGEKRIYFFHGDPTTAYIFYKDLEHKNTVVHLKKEETEWTVIDQHVKKGKKIQLVREKCQDDYFMKRMFNNLYPE